ncbi:hypothetical protein JCM8547_004365 [Rhodosporidiobolus lusitaniae]
MSAPHPRLSRSPSPYDPPFAAMEQQELLDRMHRAVVEEDILYTPVWWKDLKKTGMPRKLFGRKGFVSSLFRLLGSSLTCVLSSAASFFGTSILVEAVTKLGETAWTRLILEILLHQIEDPMLTRAFAIAKKLDNQWVVEKMKSWNPQGRAEARSARRLLSFDEDTAIVDWLDDNQDKVPAHPRQGFFTGYDPLPPRPSSPAQQPVVQRSQSPPLFSLPFPKQETHPNPAPASLPFQNNSSSKIPREPHRPVVPSAPSRDLASKQVRLSSVPSNVSSAELHDKLSYLRGLTAIGPLGNGLVVLTIASRPDARSGMAILKKRMLGIVVQAETDYQASVQARAPPLVLPAKPVEWSSSLFEQNEGKSSSSNSIPVPSAPCTQASSTRPSSSSYPPFASPPSLVSCKSSLHKSTGEPVRFWMANLPCSMSDDVMRQCFEGAGVQPTEFHFCPSHMKYPVLQGVFASAADFAEASSHLHGAILHSRRIWINREPPASPSPSHPFVFLSGLPPNASTNGLEKIARKTGCGAYGFTLVLSGTSAMGSMRVETDETAEVMVKWLNAEKSEGRQLVATFYLIWTGRIDRFP